MSIYIPWLNKADYRFPPVNQALTQPNGLLALGGDLNCERLIQAYRNGIFPWFSQGEPIMWWSPDPRTVLTPKGFHLSRSLAKFIRKTKLLVTLNQSFDQVINQCASITRDDAGTWITDDMIEAYKRLHQNGQAHSVEVWDDNTLVGGLYGVGIGQVFCGESMFHTQTNASKLAFYCLAKLMEPLPFALIDCQMHTPHLESLGARNIPREQFIPVLKKNQSQAIPTDFWQPRALR